MQQFKQLFSDPSYTATFANLQSCLRLGDLDEIDDGTHLLRFDMLGLFSFRQMTVGQAIDFWLDFLAEIGASPHYVTIHPDRMAEWAPLYRGRVPIRADPDCTWSDGSIAGHCTEFYRDEVEIGNIVNPLGTCIDAGFGLDRLDALVNGTPPRTPAEILAEGIESIIAGGYRPGPRVQGYVLRKLLRRLWAIGGTLDHPYFRTEVTRQQRLRDRYARLKPRHPDKPPEWWFDTHGIDLDEVEGPLA